MLVVPVGLMALAPQTIIFRCFACGPILIVGLGVWLQLCLASITGVGDKGVHQAYMHGRKAAGPLFLVLPFV